MFETILEDIKSFDKIVIFRHKNPDGDALGSQFGLKCLIKDNFPGKQVFSTGDGAGRYAFMDGAVQDEIPDSFFEGSLSIILDTSSSALISDDRYTLSAMTARIDHHIFCEKIAEHEVTDTSFESCCGLVAMFAKESGFKVSAQAARSLFTGMVTDSGRFRYDSTSSRTFMLASFLMEQPFETASIYSNLYADELKDIKNRAWFTQKICLSEHNVGYIYNTAEDVAAHPDMSTFDISRGMVSVMGDIRGIDIWVNFTEALEGVLCEIRSKCFNINPIAVKYGGGGHAKASGATVPDRKTAMKMLADLDEMMVSGERS